MPTGPASTSPTGHPHTLFLGREDALAHLDALACSTSSRGRFVVVQGEGGIGKTALVEAVVSRLSSPRRVLRGGADAMDRRRPYGLLVDALAPVLTEADRRVVSEGSGVAAGERLRSAIDAVTTQPALLVLEDLHWADPASLALLGRVGHTLEQLPLVVIGTLRTQARHEIEPALDHLLSVVGERGLLESITLGPLGEATCLEITERLTGHRVDDELARYTATAGGNPLFLTEMVRALQRDGALVVDSAGRATVEAPVGPSPSLAMVMMRHLSHLTPDTRELLTTAALLGTRFSMAQLRLMADRPMGDLLPLLRESFAAGFLEGADEGTLGFRHELIQDVLLHDLPTAVRAELHRDVAVRLQSAGAPAVTVAAHLLRAATSADDRGWLLDLARRTATTSPPTAVELWERIVDSTEETDAVSVEALAGLARAALSVGRTAEAWSLATTGLRWAGDSPAGATLRVVETRTALLLHEYATAHDRAVTYAAATGLAPAERAAQLAFAGWPLLLLGDSAGAMRLAREGEALAVAHGNDAALVHALSLQGLVADGHGDLEDAVALLTRAVDIAEEHPSLAAIESFPHGLLAVALADLDRVPEAAARLQRSSEVAEHHGYRTGMLVTHTFAALVRRHAGNLSDIAAELDAHRALVEPMDTRFDPPVRGLRAQVAARQGGPGAALPFATQLDPIDGREHWGGRGRSWIWMGFSQTRRAAGDHAGTFDVLWAGWRELHDLGLLMDCSELALDLVVLARGLGAAGPADLPDRVREVSGVVRALADRNPTVAHLQGLALGVEGVADGRPDAVTSAEEVMAGTPRRLDHARLAEQAALAGPSGRAPRKALALRALRSYAEVGAEYEVVRARAAFRRAGIVVPGATRPRPTTGWESLTPTEQRIAAHVATGATNPEIAQGLFISRRTVETHVSNVLAKLGLRSRTELAVLVAHRVEQP